MAEDKKIVDTTKGGEIADIPKSEKHLSEEEQKAIRAGSGWNRVKNNVADKTNNFSRKLDSLSWHS